MAALAMGPRIKPEENAMRRAHRTVHRLVWPLIAIGLLVGVTMALLLRPPPEKTSHAPAPALESQS
jgi:uncharacterized membrane protein YidH (DUF202 family)